MPTLVVDRSGLAPPTPQDALAFSLAKLQPRTLAQQVIEALVGAAAEGLILPGDRIIETELAQRLAAANVAFVVDAEPRARLAAIAAITYIFNMRLSRYLR